MNQVQCNCLCVGDARVHILRGRTAGHGGVRGSHQPSVARLVVREGIHQPDQHQGIRWGLVRVQHLFPEQDAQHSAQRHLVPSLCGRYPYDMIWCDVIWYDIWHNMIWYMIWYLFTAIGVPPGGSDRQTCTK